MHDTTKLATKLAVPVLTAAALVWLLLEQRGAPSDAAAPAQANAAVPPGTAERVEPPTRAADAASAAPTPLKLEEMSESFRNTTFLIAIRDAGFVCDDVLTAYATGDGVWTATCRDMLGYAINVQPEGALAVEPVGHYFDQPVRGIRLVAPEDR